MLGWIERLLGAAGRGISAGILSLLHLGLSGIASVIEFVFGDVTRAWTNLVHTGRDFADSVIRHAEELYRWINRIITYYIPRFAYTAWWWVTHPDSLVQVLGWYIVSWLESKADQVAYYLGGFLLSLMLRNMRDVARLAERIISAVL